MIDSAHLQSAAARNTNHPAHRSNTNGAGKARVCVVSLRGTNKQAAWCSNYEFEDVINDVDDVDLFSLEPTAGFHTRQWLVRRLIWRKGLRHLVPHVNPGLHALTIEKEYDLFVFVCMTPADMIYLSAIRGWKERSRRSICVIVESYAGWAKEYAYHLSLLRDFDHVVLCFGGSVNAVQEAIGRPCHHVSLGADVFRFSPYPRPPDRFIDIYSMGRRTQSVHEVFLKMAARKDIFYVYDTIPGLLIQPRDHREHRDLIASCAQRSRFFLTFPAKVDMAQDTRGQSEVGARFYEGAATGAVLIGQAPTAPTFARDFNWPQAVVDIGSTEESVMQALAEFRAEPSRAAALGRKNAIEAIRRFDWSYRWRDLLTLAGLEPRPALLERHRRLARLADIAETDAHRPLIASLT